MLGKIFILFFSLTIVSLSAWGQVTPFTVLHPNETIVLKPGESQTTGITIKIPTNYFLYQEKTTLTFLNLAGMRLKKIEYPQGHLRQDPFFKKRVAVFEGESVIAVTFEAPPELSPYKRVVEGLLKLQGCSDVLCYPEETHLVSFLFDVGGIGSSAAAPASASSLKELLSAQHFAELFQQTPWMILLVVFLGGLLTSLTPCVLPVIPITLMIIGIRSDRHWSHNLGLSSVLVLGLALIYALLGVAAVGFGKGLGFVFQQRGVVLLMAVLFFLLALSMFGLFEIHLPQFLRRRLNQIKGHGLWGAFVSGGAAGILAAPCAGPVVGALLLYVAATQSYFQGFGLLFVYALGMGLLFILLGTGYGTLQARFGSYRFTIWVKRFLGGLLLLGSLFYLNTVFPFQKGFETLLKKQGAVLWLNSEVEGLRRAQAEQKVMLIDFYADWCAPCKELELGFFRRSEVVGLLKEMVPVRVDATFMDEEVERVLEKYNVVGWPTIVFVAPDGQTLKDMTVVSYNPKLLLANMRLAVQFQKK